MRTEDGYMIQECLNGKPQAFGVLVDKYKEGIYSYVYAELRDFHDAQDVTQEVFLHAYRNLRTLRRWESFASWLYRIASRRCKLWIRTASRRIDTDFIEDQNPTAVDIPSLDSYHEKQMDRSVREALNSLPEVHREVLVLRYFGGMNSKEMAKAIGVSPAAIRMRLTRAREQLKEEIAAMMDKAFEGQRLPMGFTLRVVEAVKRTKIPPMPHVVGLPWGLSFAIGIFIAALILNPNISLQNFMSIPASELLPRESRALKIGEIPVDVLKISDISIISSQRGDGNDGEPDSLNLQNALFLASQGQGDTWTKKADMPEAKGSIATSVINDKIYVIGGVGPGDFPGVVYSTVEEYDPAKDTWTRKADMPTRRCSVGTSVVDGKIYAIGGCNVNGQDIPSLSTVEEYDPVTDKWTSRADMPTARQLGLSASEVDGRIYAIGGYDSPSNSGSSAVEEYDPAADKWTKKTDMPTARGGLCASVVNGRIYAIGGKLSAARFLVSSVVEEYDPATDRWTRKADMPTARWDFSTSVVNGKIYAIGGWGAAGMLSVVEEYDPATDKWTRKADMPTARHLLSTSAVKGRIYAFGGALRHDPNAVISAVEEYDTGFIGQSLEGTGMLPTTWGEVLRAMNN